MALPWAAGWGSKLDHALGGRLERPLAFALGLLLEVVWVVLMDYQWDPLSVLQLVLQKVPSWAPRLVPQLAVHRVPPLAPPLVPRKAPRWVLLMAARLVPPSVLQWGPSSVAQKALLKVA